MVRKFEHELLLEYTIMKNRRNLYKLLALLLSVNFGYSYTLYAQNGEMPITISQPQIVPVSPEAAAVQKYVCYPVNHSTGLADITIPIYTIKVGDMELPITLSYHSAGIKLRQLSGWVGTNWTLNAEPSIMREIRGIPDEEKYGGYLTAKYFNEREQSDPDKKTRFLKQVEKKIIDSEPDRFYYKLAKQSGTFYLGVETSGFKPVTRVSACCTRPYVPIHVVGWENLGSNELHITDDNGLRYEFGSESDGYTEKTGNYNTRWLCRRIVSNKTRANISFTYTDFQSAPIISSYSTDYVALEEYPGTFRNSGQAPDTLDFDCFSVKENTFLRREDSLNASRAYSASPGNYRLISKQGATTYYYRIENGEARVAGSYSNFEEYLVPSPYFATSVQERKLNSIQFDDGSISFVQGGDMNLSTITVKSKSGEIIRKVQFYITRYNEKTSLTKLDSIVVTSGRTPLERQVYSFQYKMPYNVQSEASYAMDHWGYYNGENVRNRLPIPYGRYYCNDQYYFNFGDSTRNCNETCMQVGILTDIFSPEGVHTNFTYEANRYGKMFSGDANYAKGTYLAGGLRVQRIREKDMHSGFSRTRVFSYALAKPEGSDGKYKKDLGVPKHALTERDYCTQMERLTIIPASGNTKLCRLRTWGANPVSNITFSNGSSVIYPYVREQVIDNAGVEENRTDYFFSAPYWELAGGIPNDPFDPRTQVRQDITKPFDPDDGLEALKYGQLIKKEIYEGNTLLERREYEYNYYRDPMKFNGPEVIIGRPYKTRACNLEEYGAYPQEIYQDFTWAITAGASRLKRERITTFADDGNKRTQTRDYIYCPQNSGDLFDSPVETTVWFATRHLNPIRIRTTTGSSETIEHFIYPEEAKDSITEDLGQDFLLQLHALNNLIAYKRICGADTTTLRNVYSGLAVQKVQTWNPVLSNFEDRLSYTYTPYGNISSVTSDGSTTSYLWSYYNQHPVFKMEGMTLDEIIKKTQSNGTWITDMEKQGAYTTTAATYMKMLQEMPGYRGYFYTYRPLIGVTSIKGPDGITTYFTYDSFGRLVESYIWENNVKKTITAFDYNFPTH